MQLYSYGGTNSDTILLLDLHDFGHMEKLNLNTIGLFHYQITLIHVALVTRESW